MIDWLIFLLAGGIGGFLAGLLGVGGGVIFVFVLDFYFSNKGIPNDEYTKYLIANSIFAIFFAGLSSSIKNVKANNFYLKPTLLVAIPGSLLAVLITHSIAVYNWYTRESFAVLFVSLLVVFAARMFFFKNKEHVVERYVKPRAYGFSGLFAGLISSLSGLGGGIFIVPFLNQIFRLSLQKASSISLGVLPFFALAMSLYYAFANQPTSQMPNSIGYLCFNAAIPLALGVILLAPFGVTVSKRISPSLIKVIFAILLVVVALKMIYSTWL